MDNVEARARPIPNTMESAFRAREQYNDLFPDKEAKAAAFDRLAGRYYLQNFGTFPKAEIDLLMFDAYLERLYAQEDATENDFSDYTLSKLLGITQSRVRSLKERKELKYPSSYDWKEAFVAVVDKATYHNGKIEIYLRDIRLHTELCNIVQELGSYSETQMTRQLLVVTPPVFIDLMIKASESDLSKREAREVLARILSDNEIYGDAYLHGEKSFAELIRGLAPEAAEGIVLAVVSAIPGIGPFVSAGVEKLLTEIKSSLLSKRKTKKKIEKGGK